MRILVAHQDPRTRLRLTRAARNFRSSDVAVAASPEEASRQVQDWHPDLVVMSTLMAERYRARAPLGVTTVSGDGEPDLLASLPSNSTDPAKRQPGWDRDYAALELAGILVAMDDDPPAAPRSSSARGTRQAPPPASSLGQLEDPERRILAAVAAGSTTTELAAEFGVTESVIEGHISDVVDKLHRLRDAP